MDIHWSIFVPIQVLWITLGVGAIGVSRGLLAVIRCFYYDLKLRDTEYNERFISAREDQKDESFMETARKSRKCNSSCFSSHFSIPSTASLLTDQFWVDWKSFTSFRAVSKLPLKYSTSTASVIWRMAFKSHFLVFWEAGLLTTRHGTVTALVFRIGKAECIGVFTKEAAYLRFSNSHHECRMQFTDFAAHSCFVIIFASFLPQIQSSFSVVRFPHSFRRFITLVILRLYRLRSYLKAVMANYRAKSGTIAR